MLPEHVERVHPAALVPQRDGQWPLTLAVYRFFGQFETEWNLIAADVLLTSLPVVVMYLVAQKYIVGGQTAGAVKG